MTRQRQAPRPLGKTYGNLAKETHMADMLEYEEIAGMVDHFLPDPVVTDSQLGTAARLAKSYACAAMCVSPYAVPLVRKEIRDSGVLVSAFVGFPYGDSTTQVKVAEAQRAIREGARELEMVVNLGKILSKDWRYVEKDIAGVVRLGHQHRVMVKVVFENDHLKDADKRKLCGICSKLRADVAKNSIGYGQAVAQDRDLRLMRKYCDSEVEIEAAGGIQTLNRLLAVRALGVARVATTETKAILDALKKQLRPKRSKRK